MLASLDEGKLQNLELGIMMIIMDDILGHIAEILRRYVWLR